MASLPEPTDYDVQSKLKEMDSVPLFMKSLPDDSDQPNDAFEALQALVHEGTPDEIAKNFKSQGNDYFKEKRYREALGFYTQAIDAKPVDPTLKESLLLNRAACNLELKNYGSVLRDCSSVLSSNPTSLKAFYRSALALIALEKAIEAIDCCQRALAIDAENTGIKSALQKATALKERQDRREREKVERAKAKEQERKRLNKALKERNIIVVPLAPGAPTLDLLPGLSSDDPPSLSLPVVFLYPQYSQSDIISSFDEETPFSDHLAMMFPPEGTRPAWDVTGDYTVPNLNVYAQTKSKRLLKIGKKMTLLDLCHNAGPKEGEAEDGLEMVDGHLSVIVLPKGTVEKEWIEDFKRLRGR